MSVFSSRFFNAAVVLTAASFAVGMISHAQQAGGQRTTSSTPNSSSSRSVGEERAEIWNSPQMLRARAWLQDYCSKSKKVTPEIAKSYMKELEGLSPNQMRLWLLKFDEQEEQRQQQQAFWQQGQALAVQHAQAVNRQTQQGYAAMNAAQSQSAEQAQSQIEQQREQAQEVGEDKQLGDYGGYPYGPWGNGGYHLHYHLYGGPYGGYPY